MEKKLNDPSPKLLDFDTAALMLLYLSTRSQQKNQHEFKKNEFLKWLELHHVVKKLKLQEWHIAEYTTAIVKYQYESQLHGYEHQEGDKDEDQSRTETY